MKTLEPISSDDKIIRTQITLTAVLKKMLEEKALLRKESLSQYLRRAALLSLVLEEEKKEDLNQLAKAVIGSVDLKKHPEWKTARRARSWVKNLRQEWN